jgi:23S rRNA pseudouridine1911/1915/1917 synthase
MKLIIDDFNDDIRLDIYLAEYLQDYSRSKIQSLIKNGEILVNKKSVKSSYSVKNGDVIEINIKIESDIIQPENIDIDVIWENEDMLVVNKPSGMLTHPTTVEKTGTLVNALLYKYGENLSNVNGDLRRGILHRLDRNTSGLLMIAKNNKAHEYLVEKMKAGCMDKRYLAVVKGVIKEDSFVINKSIGRNIKHPEKMCIREDGKESISEVKVLERYKDATLIEIHLITGRTHQIRVHLASVGHPVYNDTLYGFGKVKIKTEEQVLQSYKLSFPKPFSGEIITLEIPMDEKLTKVINTLRSS